MKILLCFWLLIVLALTAVAADVSGRWSGSFIITGADGETKDDTAYLVFKQDGNDVTGTVGPNADHQFPITKGKIEGNKITIEADNEGHTIKLNLQLVEDRITGDATMSGDGQSAQAKIDVTRIK